MSALKSLNTLLRIKRRRMEQCEQEVKDRLEALKTQQQSLAEAQAQQQDCSARERDCEQQIDAICGEAFTGQKLVTMQLVLAGLRDAVKQAAKAVAAVQKKVDAAQEEVVQARRAVQRAQTVVEALEKRREAALKDIDNAQEEMQDEESEEAAVARMLAATRAAQALEAA